MNRISQYPENPKILSQTIPQSQFRCKMRYLNHSLQRTSE